MLFKGAITIDEIYDMSRRELIERIQSRVRNMKKKDELSNNVKQIQEQIEDMT